MLVRTHRFLFRTLDGWYIVFLSGSVSSMLTLKRIFAECVCPYNPANNSGCVITTQYYRCCCPDCNPVLSWSTYTYFSNVIPTHKAPWFEPHAPRFPISMWTSRSISVLAVRGFIWAVLSLGGIIACSIIAFAVLFVVAFLSLMEMPDGLAETLCRFQSLYDVSHLSRSEVTREHIPTYDWCYSSRFRWWWRLSIAYVMTTSFFSSAVAHNRVPANIIFRDLSTRQNQENPSNLAPQFRNNYSLFQTHQHFTRCSACGTISVLTSFATTPSAISSNRRNRIFRPCNESVRRSWFMWSR